MTETFKPWRRDLAFALDAREAPIAPLKERLSVIAGNTSWGMVLRRGHLEITEADAQIIAEALGVDLVV